MEDPKILGGFIYKPFLETKIMGWTVLKKKLNLYFLERIQVPFLSHVVYKAWGCLSAVLGASALPKDLNLNIALC